MDIEERFQILCEQMQRFQAEGQVIVCGDFNARCGGLQDVDDANGVVHERVNIDPVANEQGELLAECLLSSGFCLVNGRKSRDDFTCISARGASVVDYCIVPVEELDYVTNFSVVTMSTCEEVLCYQEEGYRTPDHSLLRWDLTVGTGVGVSREEDSDKGSNNKVFTKYFVPHGYMGRDR